MRNKKILIKYGAWSIFAIAVGYMAMKVKKKLYKSDDYKKHLNHGFDSDKQKHVDYIDEFKNKNTELQECISYLIKLTQLGKERGSQIKLKKYSGELYRQANEISNELKEFCNNNKIDFIDLLSNKCELKLQDYSTLKNKDIDDFLIEDYIAINEKIRNILLTLKNMAKSELIKSFYQKMIQKNEKQLENIAANMI